jgi:hypothetical protein
MRGKRVSKSKWSSRLLPKRDAASGSSLVKQAVAEAGRRLGIILGNVTDDL